MDSKKLIALLEKLLEKTKQREIRWKRYKPDQEFESWASDEKSFSCIAGTMTINLVSNDTFDKMQVDIIYDKALPIAAFNIQSDEARQITLRLLNYVYDLFPNLEKCIDEFLNED